jgi:integrase
MNDKILKGYEDFVWGNYEKLNTRRVYIDHPKVMLKRIGKQYNDITQQDINKYVQYCYKNKKHNGNAIRFWSIRKFIKWTKRKDLEIPIVNPKDAGKQALTRENFDKIIETLPNLRPLHRVIGYAIIHTIRRPSEIKDILIDNIYGDRLHYKGKTGTKYCIISDHLKQAIQDYKNIERPIPKTPEDSKYLILSNYGQWKGKHPKTRQLISRIVKEIAMYSKIEIPPEETACAYLFKRTTITEQLDEYPAKYVQFQAGHIKPETTMKYQRPRDEDIKKYLTTFEHKSKDIKAKRKIRNDKSF